MSANTEEIKISAVITTQNNEDTIGMCLESIRGIDDIVIVDSFSQDRTVEIVKNYTKRIYFRRWDGEFGQKNYALSLAKHDWVLFLDSDDVLDKELTEDIYRVLARRERHTGYAVKVIVNFLGQNLNYVEKPEYRIKLFRKSKTEQIRDKQNKRFMDIDFKTEDLGRITKGRLYHFTSTTVRRRMPKIMRYASQFADDFYLTNKGRRWFINIVYWPVRTFIGNYFTRKGFKDGWPGFVWCILKAAQHFFAYARIGFKQLNNLLKDI